MDPNKPQTVQPAPPNNVLTLMRTRAEWSTETECTITQGNGGDKGEGADEGDDEDDDENSIYESSKSNEMSTMLLLRFCCFEGMASDPEKNPPSQGHPLALKKLESQDQIGISSTVDAFKIWERS